LPNTIKDSADISKALKDLGYDPVLKNDLTQREMLMEISAFADRLRNNANSEGFFWFAGHGILIDGENYLLPLDVDTDTDEMVKATSIPVSSLTRQLTGARNKANVVVLDACRIPPGIGDKGRSTGDISRVVRPVSLVPPDMVIIFSTSEGYEAKDGPANGNSPFAQAFLKHMAANVPIPAMITRVATETLTLTSNAQYPEYRGIIKDENYSLSPAVVSPVQPDQPNPTPIQPVAPIWFVNRILESFVRVEGGTFWMGSKNGRYDEMPIHEVTVNSFIMSKYPVTQKEWFDVMCTTIRQQRDMYDKSYPIKGEGDTYPMYYVSWNEAVDYCNKRSLKEGLTPVYRGSSSAITCD